MCELKKMSAKKVRLRFTYDDDLLLLREFLNVNPITNPEGWNQIQQHVFLTTKKLFQIKTLKSHLLLLIEMFLKKIKDEEIRSGVEEAYSEKDKLLEEVSSLCKDTNYNFTPPRKKTGLTKEQQLCQLGKRVRNQFASDFYNLEHQEVAHNVVVDHEYAIVKDSPAEHSEVIGANETDFASDFASSQNLTSSSSIIPSPIPTEVIAIPSTSKENLDPSKNQSAQKLNLHLSSTTNITPKNFMVPARRRLKSREPIRKNALSYLHEKFEKETFIKERQLDLDDRRVVIEEKKIKMEDRRLALEEKRFDLEHKERMEKLNLEKQKIEIDLNEKRITQQMLEAQQLLMKKILESIDTNGNK